MACTADEETNNSAAASESGGTVAGSTESELIQRLFNLQGQRATTYAELERGFRSFVQNMEPETEQRYLAVVQASTATFANLSKEVNAVGETIKMELQQPQLAGVIRDIQDHEKIKLEMTATLHVLKKAKAAKELLRVEENGSGDAASIMDEDPHSHTHRQPGGCSCGPPPPEPTMEELNAAISEATENVQKAVAHINGILEELRYFREDS